MLLIISPPGRAVNVRDDYSPGIIPITSCEPQAQRHTVSCKSARSNISAERGEGSVMARHSILIVDDEANQRLMLEQALRALACDWVITTVASGQEALDSLALRA